MHSAYVSFLNADNQIVYELTDYYQTYLGCVKYVYLEYYGDKLCQRLVALNYPYCLRLHLNSTQWDFLRVIYNDSKD